MYSASYDAKPPLLSKGTSLRASPPAPSPLSSLAAAALALPANGPPRVEHNMALSVPITSTSQSASSESISAMDNAEGPKQPKKRGRKRLAEPLEDVKDNPSLDADAKRKLQNRAAQRAFRERKEKHLADLEERVKTQEAQLDAAREVIRSLVAEAEALRSGGAPTRTVIPDSFDLSAPSASPRPAVIPSVLLKPDTSPEDVKPVDSSASPDSARSSSLMQRPAPLEATLAAPPLLPPVLPPSPVAPTAPSNVESVALDDFMADFDAPFDFSDSITLPPLFSSLLEQSDLVTSGATSAAGPDTPAMPGIEYQDDVCPGEDHDEPPPLPGGRIPCDKPECDFSSQSCMLPIPWRPPTVPDGDKHLWLAQKCWAKLVSHPLFSQVDPDELCQELRDHTRCSTDGRLVCHKSDVCDIFRSIPLKAKLRAQALSMQ